MPLPEKTRSFDTGPRPESAQCECCGSEMCDIKKGKEIARDIIENGGSHTLETNPPLLPSWYNHSLILRGQSFFFDHLFAMFVGMLCGLIAILAIPSILHVLKSTNKSSCPITAYKRYLNTINNVMCWYRSDLRNPNSKARQSFLNVRSHHSAASLAHGPITQKDMALTQFGFIGFAVISSKKLGLPKCETGFLHLWRVIGHLLGMKNRFNLCQGNLKCTQAACEELAEKVFGPNLDKPAENFDHMSRALISGVWVIVPFLNYPCILELTRRLCGLSPKKVPALLRPLLFLQLAVHWLLNVKLVSFLLRKYLNFLMWFSLFLQNVRYPIATYIHFSLMTAWTQNAEKNMHK